MKNLLFALLLVLPVFSLSADVIPQSICAVLTGLDQAGVEYLMVEAIPSATTSDDLITLEIVSVLKGELDQSNIFLFDACDENFSSLGWLFPASSYLLGDLILALIVPANEDNTCGDFQPGSFVPVSSYNAGAFPIEDGFAPMAFYEFYQEIAVPVVALSNANGDWCGIDLTNGVEVLSESEISIFPNPTADIVKLDGTLSESFGLSVYSQYGQFIFREKEYSEELDISRFPKGVYFIQIITETGKQAVRKLVKL